MPRILLIDFDGTIAARAADKSGHIVYNDSLIECAIEAQKKGMLIIGFTSWSHFNYGNDQKRFSTSPARSEIITGLANKGLILNAVVTSGTYFSVINKLIEDNQCNLHSIQALNDQQRLEYLGHFFNTHIAQAEIEQKYTYGKESEAVYPETLYKQLKKQEDELEANENIHLFIDNLNKELSTLTNWDHIRLTHKSRETEKRGMLQVIELLFMGSQYHIHLLFDDKSEPIDLARMRGYGVCRVVLDNTGPDYQGISRNRVDYQDFITDFKCAYAFSNLIDIAVDIPETLGMHQDIKNIVESFSIETFKSVQDKCRILINTVGEKTYTEKQLKKHLEAILKNLTVLKDHPKYLLYQLKTGGKGAARVAHFINQSFDYTIPTTPFLTLERGVPLVQTALDEATEMLESLNQLLTRLPNRENDLIMALIDQAHRHAIIIACKKILIADSARYACGGRVEKLDERFNSLVALYPHLDYRIILVDLHIHNILKLANFIYKKLYLAETKVHFIHKNKNQRDARLSKTLARELLDSLISKKPLNAITERSLNHTNFFASRIFKEKSEHAVANP